MSSPTISLHEVEKRYCSPTLCPRSDEEIQANTPDRKTIRKAIKNLEGLWEHLTMGERSRLMSQLVASIDHDPNDSTLSITLSPLGLKSFATQNPDKEESEKS